MREGIATRPSKKSLRVATAADRAFCEALARVNMRPYLVCRGLAWDSLKYAHDWPLIESWVIEVDGEPVGVVRFSEEKEALYVRDLQVRESFRCVGLGTWAMAEVKEEARARGLKGLRLKVAPENPAKRLYERLGYVDMGAEGSGRKMVCNAG